MAKNVEEPGIRVQTVALGRGEQTHDGSGTLAGGFRAGKELVLAADGDGPDAVFGRVVVHGAAGVAGDLNFRS